MTRLDYSAIQVKKQNKNNNDNFNFFGSWKLILQMFACCVVCCSV